MKKTLSPAEFEALFAKVKAGERDWSKLLTTEQYSVDLMFRLFWASIMPNCKDVPPHQLLDMQAAFYAGYAEAFKALNEFATALTEKRACQFLDQLTKELDSLMGGLLKRLDKTQKRVDDTLSGRVH